MLSGVILIACTDRDSVSCRPHPSELRPVNELKKIVGGGASQSSYRLLNYKKKTISSLRRTRILLPLYPLF